MTSIYRGTDLGQILEQALEEAGTNASRAALAAGKSAAALHNAIRGTTSQQGAEAWMGRILGGTWVCVQRPGWAVAMRESDAQRLLWDVSA